MLPLRERTKYTGSLLLTKTAHKSIISLNFKLQVQRDVFLYLSTCSACGNFRFDSPVLPVPWAPSEVTPEQRAESIPEHCQLCTPKNYNYRYTYTYTFHILVFTWEKCQIMSLQLHVNVKSSFICNTPNWEHTKYPSTGKWIQMYTIHIVLVTKRSKLLTHNTI